jgi:regulator of sigma E protease
MLTALLIIPILTFLIFVHELGHYTMARRAGVKVEEFGFGLPPRIWGIQRGDTLWSINWIPLGGFVRVLGEDGKDKSERSMQAKTAGQRALFLGAGSIMNFITAFVLIFILLVAHGERTSNVYITDVAQDSPALEGGLEAGDRVISINGDRVASTGAFRDATTDNLGSDMTLTVLRDGVEKVTTITPREHPPVGQGAAGVSIADVSLADIVVHKLPAGSIAASYFEEGDRIVSVGGIEVVDSISYRFAISRQLGQSVEAIVNRDGSNVPIIVNLPANLGDGDEELGAEMIAKVKFEAVNPLRAIPMAFTEFFDFIRMLFDGLVMILNGEVPLSQVAGPIGMGQLTSEIVQQSSVPGWVAILTITIVLSLNLAILNLLPLPALDGGRLMFVAIEVLRRGKRVAPEKEGLVHMVGLVVLLTLMVAVAFVDIDRIISGGSLLQ